MEQRSTKWPSSFDLEDNWYYYTVKWSLILHDRDYSDAKYEPSRSLVLGSAKLRTRFLVGIDGPAYRWTTFSVGAVIPTKI
jgi:hypothetical protein